MELLIKKVQKRWEASSQQWDGSAIIIMISRLEQYKTPKRRREVRQIQPKEIITTASEGEQ